MSKEFWGQEFKQWTWYSPSVLKMFGSSAGKIPGLGSYIQSHVWILGGSDSKIRLLHQSTGVDLASLEHGGSREVQLLTCVQVLGVFQETWKWSESVSCSVVSNSLWPHELYSLPDSSVHGLLQARILGWVAILFSSRSPWATDWT